MAGVIAMFFMTTPLERCFLAFACLAQYVVRDVNQQIPFYIINNQLVRSNTFLVRFVSV